MPSAVVVGAGVFGASLAHRLVLARWDVTLVEQYPPGHVRAASGGESRLIRFAHGRAPWYTRSAWRARDLWQGIEEEAGTQLFVPAGVVWLARGEDGWEAESEATLRAEHIPCARLAPDEVASLFPDPVVDDIAFALHEPEAGILRARDATRALFRLAVAGGARFVAGRAEPSGREVVVDGERLSADIAVWACGAWLPRVFPDLVRLRVTKQDVFFFGAPLAWETPPLPAWIDYEAAIYGLGDLDGRGVKVASNREGEDFDPEMGPRVASEGGENAARAYVRGRFPALADAPLVGARTCQYALTADTNFIVAPHPEHEGVWILGGGSGHGFKHGPALAEYVFALLDGRAEPDERFGLGERPVAAGFRARVGESQG